MPSRSTFNGLRNALLEFPEYLAKGILAESSEAQ
jgi:hypothetical protein